MQMIAFGKCIMKRVSRQSDVDGFVRQVLILGASRSPFYEPKILVLGGTIEERCLVRVLPHSVGVLIPTERGRTPILVGSLLQLGRTVVP